METPANHPFYGARKARLGLGGFALVALLSLVMLLGMAPRAQAENIQICNNVTLAAYGSYGDRCYAWEWEARPYLVSVGIQTFERAGCLTSAAQYSGDLKESWYCVGNASYGERYVVKTSEPRRGVIRNNNLTYSGRFSGWELCCFPH